MDKICLDTISILVNKVQSKIWDFRNSELKDRQKAQGIIKKMSHWKYKDASSSLSAPQSKYKPTQRFNYLDHIILIINNFITFGINPTDTNLDLKQILTLNFALPSG